MSMRVAFHFYICLAKQKQTNDEHQSFKQHGNLDTNKYKLIKCSGYHTMKKMQSTNICIMTI